MAKYVFGIDLGTTYSCIARVDDTGRPEIIKNREGENITPSVVQFDGDTVIVGDTAKEEAVLHPETTAMLVKTLMGKTDFAISYNGKDRSPEEVSSYILKKLVEDASEQLGVEVKDVVITCPAYFGTAEREATKKAGEIAKLNVLEIISEPTAAALYYGCAKEQNEKTILVYDLGGGTFDVTIMRITSDTIEVICSDGDHDLGGKNWDEVLIRYLADQFIEKVGEKVEFDDYAAQDLRLKAEEMKKQLTSKNQASKPLDVSGKKQKILITREEFDKITSTLLENTIDKTKDAIEVARKKGYGNIDEILLVGGSTRMPQVKEALSKEFGDSEIKILEPDEAVAKGAAIHAVNVYINNQEKIKGKSWINDDEETKNLNPNDYKDKLAVSPSQMSFGGKAREIIIAATKSFATKVIVDSEARILKCYNMIIKNDPMPKGVIKVSKVFFTVCDNQEIVSIGVYENDFMDEYFEPDEDLKIGEAELEMPRNLPKGSPIEVTFKLNKEGILEMRGLDQTGNREVNIRLETKGVMPEEKLEEIKKRVQAISLQK